MLHLRWGITLTGWLLKTLEILLRRRRMRRDHERRVRHHLRLARKRINYPPLRVYRQRTSYEMMSEELCARRLRFSKEAMGCLCEMLKEDLKPNSNCRTALTVEMKLTTALNFFASGSFQHGISDICNISQNTARTCIHQVMNAIYHKASELIIFDTSPVKLKERSIAFYRIAGFPKVIGAVDGTHVALKAPGNDTVSFVNGKGFHSLNVMIVCDAQMRILTVNANNRGSAHDSFVLESSMLHRSMTTPPGIKGWLLGDKGYPLRTWLMTSFRSTNNEAQKRYNCAHVTTRQVVERTITVLKSRFRCLDRSGGTLQYAPEIVSKIVIVCCALHNFAIQHGLNIHPEDVLPPEMDELEEGNMEPDADIPPGAGVQAQAPSDARAIRDRLAAAAFGH
ncbi:putative nuclease HARBI1 [Scyliorhinus torazame]|uniref:putative nuclease HARBI1 n=1 Tax=Scyliorhinus torazame TaxID=75743 RepID=UPI003B5A92E9